MKHALHITCDDRHITRRAHQAVSTLIEQGHDAHDIARLTGCTVAMLIDPSTSLRRPHYKALNVHYQISYLWLWTGLGSMFTQSSSSHLKSTVL